MQSDSQIKEEHHHLQNNYYQRTVNNDRNSNNTKLHVISPIPSTSAAPPSNPTHGLRHDVKRSSNKFMVWKLLPSPLGFDPKKKLFRVNGVCDENPKYNVVLLQDPRNSKKKHHGVSELFLPNFLIDDNYCAVPIKREFTIIGLNDNIDECFLRGLCKKSSEPLEVTVYYHPLTKRHLGMAFMDFSSKAESDAFIAKHDGKTMMGSTVTCFFDPMGYKVSKLFEDATNLPTSIPKRYSNVKSSKVICHIRKLLDQIYDETGKDEFNSLGQADILSLPKVTTTDREIAVTDTDFGFNSTKNHDSNAINEECQPNVNGKLFGNSLFDSSKEKIKLCIENGDKHSRFDTPVNDNTKSSSASTSQQFAKNVQSADVSVDTNGGEKHKSFYQNNPCSNDDTFYSQISTNGAPDLKNFPSHSFDVLNADKKLDVVQTGNNETHDSVGLSSYTKHKQSQNRASRSSMETHSDTDSESCSSLASGSKNRAKKISSPNLTNNNISTELLSSKGEVTKSPKRINNKRGTHRWSSSSDDEEFCSSDKGKNDAKNKRKSDEKLEKSEIPQNKSLSNQFVPSVMPSVPSCSLLTTFPSASDKTPLGSLCSPKQFSVGQSPALTSVVSQQNLSGNQKMSGKFISNLAHLPVSLRQHLPPPGLINPPTPVGMSSSQSVTKPSSGTTNLLPSKAQNLEQRLVQIFGISSINSNASSTNDIYSNSSSQISSTNEKDNFLQSPNLLTPNSYSHHLAMTAPNSYLYPSSSIFSGNSTRDVIDVRQFPVPPPPEDQESEQKRIDTEMKRKRQEEIMKCFDATNKARNTLEVDLKIMLQKDLQRRLESEALKMLDEEWALLEEQRKKKEIKPQVIRESNRISSESSKFLSIFPAFDNILDTEGNDNIFGISYTERMRTLPSFKKKKIEIKKPVNKHYHQNHRSPRHKHHRKSTRDDTNYKKQRDSKDNMLSRHSYHHYESRIRKHSEDNSDFDRNELVKKLHNISKNKAEKRERTEKRISRPVRSMSSSQRSSSQSSESTSASSDREENNRTMDRESISRHSSSVRISQAPSEPDSGNDDDDPCIDVSQEESNDEEEVEIKHKKSPLKSIQSTIKEKSKKLLSALFKEDSQSCSTLCSEAGSPGALASPSVANSPAPSATERVEFALDEINKMEMDDDFESISTPPLTKRPKMVRELAALLEDAGAIPSTTQTAEKHQTSLWPKRSDAEELEILYQFQRNGINEEDCAFFKLASMKLCDYFDKYVVDGRKLCWVEPNMFKTPRELPSSIKRNNVEMFYDDPELAGIVPHTTGCARTEGFYKIKKERKRIIRRFDDNAFDARTIISTQDEVAIRHKTQAAKDERAMNRRLRTWMGESNLLRVNQLKYRSKMIKFSRSRIHGWGLYALETITPEEMIIEYVGEKIRPTVADEREKNYERRGMGSSYMFRIDGDAVIDATKMGNYGRFINHSCAPNCTARVVTVEGDKRIVIYSKRLIEKGEEITYDYKFAREDEASKIECLCGSKCCQRYLN